MLTPKFKIKKTKIGSGHYLLQRSDGLTYEVRRLPKSRWSINSRPEKTTLRSIIFDMAHGYTSEDWFNDRYPNS